MSLANTVLEWMSFEDLEEKDRSLTDWIDYEVGYRTAPATSGVLIIGFNGVISLNI